MVKVERVNFPGVEGRGLADVTGKLGGWGDAAEGVEGGVGWGKGSGGVTFRS